MSQRTVRWMLLPILVLLPAAGCRKSRPTGADGAAGPITGAAAADADSWRSAADAASVDAASPAAAYPVDDLLAVVREPFRAGLAERAGVGHLSELTLYEIDLQLNLDAGTYRAVQNVDFNNRTGETLSSIVFRCYGNAYGRQGEPPPIAIRSARVAGAAASVETVGVTTFRIPLAEPLPPGRRVKVALEFDATLPRHREGETSMLRQALEMLKNLTGMGSAAIEGYGILSVGDGIASLASWYPVVARYRAEEKRWDDQEPTGIGDIGTEELANYRVTVHVPGGAVVASSGVPLGDVRTGPPETVGTWGGAALRDFTVLASRDYRVETARLGDITVNAYVPEKHAEFGRRIVEYAVAALEVYQRRFGDYALTELDVAAAPLLGGAGGVEFPGIVTVATMLLQDLGQSLGPLAPAGIGRIPMLDEMVEFVVVHEVAHQWWNAMVGSDSVRHPFIDEGMAQYSSILYFEDRYGAERAKLTGDRNVRLNYLIFRLMGNPDAAVDRATGDFDGMLDYAALVYGKGPYFYEAVRKAIGDEAFGRAFRRYFEENRYRTVDPEAFTRIAGEVSGKAGEVAALHRRWLHEAHGDEDLGTADLPAVMAMVMGDAEGMQGLLGGLGGIDMGDLLAGLLGGDGGGLGALLGQLTGGGADGGGAGALLGQLMGGGADGGAGDLAGMMAMMQQMMGGGADGGAGDLAGMMAMMQQMMGGGPDGGGLGEMDLASLAGLARRLLAPLAAGDPRMAKLLDMLDRLSRGEELTLFDAIEALRVLMGILGGDESGDGEGGLGDDTDQFLRLLQMAQPFLGGASTAPAPVPVPVP